MIKRLLQKKAKAKYFISLYGPFHVVRPFNNYISMSAAKTSTIIEYTLMVCSGQEDYIIVCLGIEKYQIYHLRITIVKVKHL